MTNEQGQPERALGKLLRKLIIVPLVGFAVDKTIEYFRLESFFRFLPYIWLAVALFVTFEALRKLGKKFGISEKISGLNKRTRTVVYVASALIVVLLVSGYWVGIMKVFEWRSGTQFEVTPALVVNGTAIYGTGMWMVSSPDVMYPVGIEMFLRLRSTAPVVTMIDSMHFDIKTESNTWEPLTEMYRGVPYLATRNEGFQVSMPLLKNVVEDKNIQPGETLGGWVLLDYPTSAQIPVPDWKAYSQTAQHEDQHFKVGDAFVFSAGYSLWSAVPPLLPEFRVTITDLQGKSSVVLFSTPTGPEHFGDQELRLSVSSSDYPLDNIPVQFFRLSP